MGAPTESKEEKLGKIKTGEEGSDLQGSDLQSRKLPGELLELIISNLPTEEAGRWRCQWKYGRQHLKLKEGDWETSSDKSQDFYVNEFFTQLIHNASIKTCRIAHCGVLFLRNCNDWMKYTVAYLPNNKSAGIEEVAIQYDQRISFSDDEILMCLDLFDDGVSDEDGLLSCNDRFLKLFALSDDGVSDDDDGLFHLRKLQLQGNNWNISNEKLLSPFVNLETLKLRRVTFSGKAEVGNIIMGCGSLENLIIEDCLGLIAGFKINGNNDNMRMKRLEINRVLQIHCGSISYRFPIPPHVVVAQPINPVLHFPNLMVLRTTMDLNRVWHNLILRDMFRKCTKLQEVDIFIEVDKDDDGRNYLPEEEGIWRREFCDNIACNLGLFRIKGFSGREREMRLVDYLITNATKLKKLVIQFDKVTSQQEEELKQEVLSLPKSSLDVSIIFDSF